MKYFKMFNFKMNIGILKKIIKIYIIVSIYQLKIPRFFFKTKLVCFASL